MSARYGKPEDGALKLRSRPEAFLTPYFVDTGEFQAENSKMLVARFSYIDLDGGTIRGGRFWRFTPMVNWHLSDHVRLELAYGYGVLDRFSLTGATQFFQSRLQLQF
jgi:phosphate-selective porin